MFLRRRDTHVLSDEELVVRLRAGHQSALEALWDRYVQLLFGVAMKYLRDTERAKDLVLELFAALPALLAKHEVQHLRPWLHAVTRNRCLMELRKLDPTHVLGEPAAEEDAAEDAVLRETSLQRLEAAIDRLNEAQARCIRLFYLERASYRQVAERTGLDMEQVRSHLQNGRRNLRLMLKHP